MKLKNIENYRILLASNSPRRQELLKGLDVDFDVKIIPGIDESYPATLPAQEVPLFLSKKKSEAYVSSLGKNDLLITADTVVVLDGSVYGKPANEAEAKTMLSALSGKMHQVVTGVTLTSQTKSVSFSSLSNVRFSILSPDEIDYYVSAYRPMDKAGSYGIQEWIGYIGIDYIEGSYFNIMGLPVQKLYQELKKF